jgi:N-acetylglucosaminyl-diphospho-decaprenol L-rhamnosyltransferase
MKINCTVVIPTYYTGDVIYNLLDTIPNVTDIFILDNSNDEKLRENIKKKYQHIHYLGIGDVGLGKTFNKALSMVNTNLLFITQPDVVLKKNCIENLIYAIKKYKSSAIVSPLFFENNKYSQYDHYTLKLNSKKEIVTTNTIYKNYTIPSGDFCVEAINSTAFLIDVSKVKEIGGWDEYYYTYLEDIDFSYRIRCANYEIIKIKDAKIDHIGFGSHDKEKSHKMNEKRIFNFTKSSIYFDFKNRSKLFFFKKVLINIIKYFLKLLINVVLLRKKKVNENLIKIKANYYFFVKDKLGITNNQI